jgi:hypothetical protein
MKNKFTKIILATVVCLAWFTSVNAQGRFSAGAELAMPMGDFADLAGFGFGASLGYELPVTDNIGITANAGYLMFGKKTMEVGPLKTEYQYSMIPIQLGGKYYFGETMEGIYLGAQVGVHMLMFKFKTEAYSMGGITIPAVSESDSKTKLSYAPVVGYHLANIDLSARYQMVATEGSTTSFIGLRIAYVFGEK